MRLNANKVVVLCSCFLPWLVVRSLFTLRQSWLGANGNSSVLSTPYILYIKVYFHLPRQLSMNSMFIETLRSSAVESEFLSIYIHNTEYSMQVIHETIESPEQDQTIKKECDRRGWTDACMLGISDNRLGENTYRKSCTRKEEWQKECRTLSEIRRSRTAEILDDNHLLCC